MKVRQYLWQVGVEPNPGPPQGSMSRDQWQNTIREEVDKRIEETNPGPTYTPKSLAKLETACNEEAGRGPLYMRMWELKESMEEKMKKGQRKGYALYKKAYWKLKRKEKGEGAGE